MRRPELEWPPWKQSPSGKLIFFTEKWPWWKIFINTETEMATHACDTSLTVWYEWHENHDLQEKNKEHQRSMRLWRESDTIAAACALSMRMRTDRSRQQSSNVRPKAEAKNKFSMQRLGVDQPTGGQLTFIKEYMQCAPLMWDWHCCCRLWIVSDDEDEAKPAAKA